MQCSEVTEIDIEFFWTFKTFQNLMFLSRKQVVLRNGEKFYENNTSIRNNMPISD